MTTSVFFFPVRCVVAISLKPDWRHLQLGHHLFSRQDHDRCSVHRVGENGPLVREMKTIGCPTPVRECTMWKIRVTAFLLTFSSFRCLSFRLYWMPLVDTFFRPE